MNKKILFSTLTIVSTLTIGLLCMKPLFSQQPKPTIAGLTKQIKALTAEAKKSIPTSKEIAKKVKEKTPQREKVLKMPLIISSTTLQKDQKEITQKIEKIKKRAADTKKKYDALLKKAKKVTYQ